MFGALTDRQDGQRSVFTNRNPEMNRISFRQGMLLGFHADRPVARWYGDAQAGSSKAWSTKAALNERAGDELTAIQELGERTVDIERSAAKPRARRPGVSPTFRRTSGRSRWRGGGPRRHARPSQSPCSWLADGGGGLAQWPGCATAGQAELAPLLVRLWPAFGAAGPTVDRKIAKTLDPHAGSQSLSAGHGSLALFGALLVAVAMAWWLVRPVRDLEQAIVRLGANRLPNRSRLAAG